MPHCHRNWLSLRTYIAVILWVVLIQIKYASTSRSSEESSRSSEESRNAQNLFGYCPDKNGWREAPFMCWRESFHHKDFQGALKYCYNDNLKFGPGNNLMPVGKLRRYDLLVKNDDEKVFWNEDGPFRVNAYKNDRCEWVEFPSGKKVPFHHFPEFDQGSGKTGDTLVWYPKSNHLAVESQGIEASVLCYRPKLDLCRECADAELDSECNDAGDCWRGKCICDPYFSGFKCQIPPPRNDRDILVVGGQGLSGPLQSVEVYDIADGGSSLARTVYPEQIYGSIGTFIEKGCDYGESHSDSDSSRSHYSHGRSSNSDSSSSESSHEQSHSSSSSSDSSSSDSSSESAESRRARRSQRPLVCGGVTINNEVINSCYSLDEDTQQWVIEPFMNYERGYAAAASISPRGDLWVVGGVDRHEKYLKSTELLDLRAPGTSEEDVAGHWHTGPHLHERTWKPCVVQISDCETAVIGGYRGTTDSNKISIYNWHREEWTDGPALRFAREAHACARIKDPYTNHVNVLIVGGFNAATGQLVRTSELWDPTLGVTSAGMGGGDLEIGMDDHCLLELDEYQLIRLGGNSAGSMNEVYQFDLETGLWTLEGELIEGRQGHTCMMIPKGYVKGLRQNPKRRLWDSNSRSRFSSSSSSHSHSRRHSRSHSSSSSESHSRSSSSSRHESHHHSH